MTAVLLALASSCALAVGTVLAHRAAGATARAAGEEAGRGGLLRPIARLLRYPGFMAAQLAGLLGFVLHAAALATGVVVVVQPLLCTGLVIALVLAALVDRRHPGRPQPDGRQWIAAVLVVLGLGLFLVTAAPTAGRGHAGGPALPLAVAAFAALALATAGVVRRGAPRHAALLLGAVAGTGFGLLGVLLKVVTQLPVADWPTSAPLYALIGVGLTGTAFAQWSYASGPLVQSQPVLAALEPVVALALAGPVLAEGLAGGLFAHAGQLAGLALMVVGVVGIARQNAAIDSGRPTACASVLPPADRTPERSGTRQDAPRSRVAPETLSR